MSDLFFSHSPAGSFHFTREPANITYFFVNDQVQLVWEYNSQLGTPGRINFAKFDHPSSVYDSLVDRFPKQTFVYIHSSRLDVVGLATLRINSTLLSDAGIYRCTISHGSSVISSIVTLKVGKLCNTLKVGKLRNVEQISYLPFHIKYMYIYL